MTDEDHGNFQPISIDVEAALKEARQSAYNKGFIEGQSSRNNELYKEAINDILFRVRANPEFNTDRYEPLLLEIERMKP